MEKGHSNRKLASLLILAPEHNYQEPYFEDSRLLCCDSSPQRMSRAPLKHRYQPQVYFSCCAAHKYIISLLVSMQMYVDLYYMSPAL